MAGGGGTPAIDAIGDRALNTFKLGAAGLVFAVALGVPLGILAALKRGAVIDWLARVLAVIGQATPSFWLGLMMIFFFAVQLGWFPTGGAQDGFRSLILPAVSLGMLEMAAIMRLTRSGMIEVLDTDFIRTARAKGLSERVVITAARRAARAAAGRDDAGPLAWAPDRRVGDHRDRLRLAGDRPADHRLDPQADYPMVQASIIVLAASIALTNLLVDVSYRLIDPRIRAGAA